MIKIFPKYFISVTKGSKLLSDMTAITAHNQKASTCSSQASPTFKKRRKKKRTFIKQNSINQKYMITESVLKAHIHVILKAIINRLYLTTRKNVPFQQNQINQNNDKIFTNYLHILQEIYQNSLRIFHEVQVLKYNIVLYHTKSTQNFAK